MARPVRVRKEQVWEYIDPPSGDSCRLWRGPVHQGGYGIILQDNRTYWAHRLAYESAVGAIPDGMLIRHTCDTPLCCNPNHLLIGTDADNCRDMMERRRHASFTKPSYSPRGERHGMAVLTEPQVREIRVRYFGSNVTQQALADEFGVTKGMVSCIVRGKSWKHLDDNPTGIARQQFVRKTHRHP